MLIIRRKKCKSEYHKDKKYYAHKTIHNIIEDMSVSGHDLLIKDCIALRGSITKGNYQVIRLRIVFHLKYMLKDFKPWQYKFICVKSKDELNRSVNLQEAISIRSTYKMKEQYVKCLIKTYIYYTSFLLGTDE